MKQIYALLRILGLSTLALHPIHASNPVCGWYAGLLLGGSYQPKVRFTVINPITGLSTPGDLTHSGYGAIAGQFGYRLENIRLEAELMGTGSPYKTLQVGNLTIDSSKNNPVGFSLQGSSTTIAFLANAFYDFHTRGGDSSPFFPFVGLGIGAANNHNTIKLFNNGTPLQGTRLSNTASIAAVQGILGMGYYMDDYTAFGLDYRYFTTQSIRYFGAREQINTINLTFNGSF